MSSIIKKPGAWVPMALSLAVLATFLVSIVIAGAPTRQPDEGTAAHIFQIWLVLEVVMIIFFAVKWLPQAPKQALLILTIQIIAVLAACAPVYYFKL
jgi:hypothetical protein